MKRAFIVLQSASLCGSDVDYDAKRVATETPPEMYRPETGFEVTV